VPAGRVAGLPVGLSFFGAAWSEPQLLRAGHAFELASAHRVRPTFAPTIAATPR
jgi:amidase